MFLSKLCTPHVKMLRGHLGKCRGYIATVWGIGYKFDPDAAR